MRREEDHCRIRRGKHLFFKRLMFARKDECISLIYRLMFLADIVLSAALSGIAQ